MKTQNAKIRKTINYLIRAGIILLTYSFIYHQVFINHKLKEFSDMIRKTMESDNAWYFAALLLAMMLLNWSLESLKWKVLIDKIERISFFRSLKAVFAGVSVSMFTPNRTGEYLGRVFILKQGSPVEGIFATLVGSFSQIIVTFSIGLMSLLSFVDHYLREPYRIGEYLFTSLIFIVPCLVFVIILAYFKIGVLTDLLNRFIPGKWERVKQFAGIFSKYTGKELSGVLLLSLARFAIFSTQFYLLLRIFGAGIPVAEAYILIPVIYLIMALVPSIALAELGIRGSVSLFVIGLYYDKIGRAGSETEMIILAASSMLWLINLAIPAILGTFFVFSLKFFRK
jgi:hypothetical protein